MKKLSFLCLIMISVFCCSLSYADEQGLLILQKSDNSYFPAVAKFNMRIEDYEKEQYKRFYQSDVFVKGSDQYLLIGLEPAIIKGRSQLRVKDTIYYYLKKVDKITQVSAKVAFYNSTLSQEDVMNTKLSTFYNLDSYSSGEEDGKSVYVVNLVAKNKEVAYFKIVSYVDAESYLPIKRDYFSFSGQKIKEMIFEDIQFKDGKLASLKFTMYDSLRKGFYTKVIMSDFNHNTAIPDTYFTKSYMKIAAK